MRCTRAAWFRPACGCAASRSPCWPRNKPDVIHADLAACNAYKDATARAAAVKCPTVLVLGDGDLMTPAAKAKPLAAAIAGARTVVIKNSGHFMMVERPDETLEALKSYV